MSGYPPSIAQVNQPAPVPRRIRATLGEQLVVDTTSALYVWEWPHYPQYYIPIADVDPAVLVGEQHEDKLSRGTARRHGLRAGGVSHPAAVLVYGDDAIEGLAGMARLEWAALDAWHEEDEQVFVHPATLYPRRCTALDSPYPHRTGRRRVGRVRLTGAGLRDRVADPATTSIAPN